MKKLMIAAVAVAFAAGVQAANCTWGTQVLSFGDKTIADESVSASIFQISQADYAYIAALGATDGQKALYEGYNAEAGSLTINGTTYATAYDAGETSWDGVVGFKSMKNYNPDDHSTVAAIILLDSDATSGFVEADYYMANVGDYVMGSKAASPDFLGTTWASETGASMAWQSAGAVPEPTSGLLLLLGVAGLALRRRRA